jgi:hypothetical protein
LTTAARCSIGLRLFCTGSPTPARSRLQTAKAFVKAVGFGSLLRLDLCRSGFSDETLAQCTPQLCDGEGLLQRPELAISLGAKPAQMFVEIAAGRRLGALEEHRAKLAARSLPSRIIGDAKSHMTMKSCRR